MVATGESVAVGASAYVLDGAGRVCVAMGCAGPGGGTWAQRSAKALPQSTAAPFFQYQCPISLTISPSIAFPPATPYCTARFIFLVALKM